ncbi:MAG: tyrosine recombinase XerC [Hydrogenophaga sp.]|jgi:integrase/recombinase XerC|uniref:tyrosine recombinase XerC n=2 Tax=Hydrogenophaga sp. TaxID=1904254 RepID=UPI000EB9E038|nr:tyrosine recombinase XerC [Hydrogenophaga sp.]MDD3784909.1 tyrosine recombinase XerC [Hydrogenophaga sp.]MDX9969272.1 tyrosine recombinase XerC [Hydrogenophaga sp.]HAJ14480.1 recombinase XerC [Comamonadaceae bacterium]
MEMAHHPIDDANLVQAYLTHARVEKRLADRSLTLYRAALQRLLELAAAHGVGLRDVGSHVIRQGVAGMHAAGRSPKGIALVLSGWRGFYVWLGREGQVGSNPVSGVRAPKAGRPLPKALDVDDAVALAAYTDADEDPVREARDACIVELLYGCGLRIGELVGLDVAASAAARGWPDLDDGVVHVLGKGGKRRSVPIGAQALAALGTWLQARAAWAGAVPALFINPQGGRLTPQHIRWRLRQRSARSGLATPVHPHMLRHSFASHVLQSSGDLRAVQELLGHASIGTTQVYTRLDYQHLARVYDAAHPRAGRKPDRG